MCQIRKGRVRALDPSPYSGMGLGEEETRLYEAGGIFSRFVANFPNILEVVSFFFIFFYSSPNAASDIIAACPFL